MRASCVQLRVNGTVVTPLVTMSSGANGYYYLLLAPGTIASSGSDVLAYVTSSSETKRITSMTMRRVR